MGLDLPREDLLEAEIVGDTGEDGRVRERERGERSTPLAEAARQLFGEMHRVTHAAAVAADENPAPAVERVRYEIDGPLHRLEQGRVAQTRFEDLDRLGEPPSGRAGLIHPDSLGPRARFDKRPASEAPASAVLSSGRHGLGRYQLFEKPFLSIVVVTWKGGERLGRCLESIRRDLESKGGAGEVELILVENGPDARLPGLTPDLWPEMRRVSLARNLGFSGGANAGIASARGEWVATLNDDSHVEPGFHAAMSRAAAGAPPRCGMLQPCLRQVQDAARIDSAGVEIRFGGEIRDRGRGEAAEAFEGDSEVFCASAGAAWYRRSMLLEIATEESFFDPDYFMYFEDVDLGWRARLAGWQALYIPDARVRHDLHGSASSHPPGFVKRQCSRNRIRVVLANASFAFVLRAVPRLVRDMLWLVFDMGPRGLVEIGSGVRSGLEARRRLPASSRKARKPLESRWFTGR